MSCGNFLVHVKLRMICRERERGREREREKDDVKKERLRRERESAENQTFDDPAITDLGMGDLHGSSNFETFKTSRYFDMGESSHTVYQSKGNKQQPGNPIDSDAYRFT